MKPIPSTAEALINELETPESLDRNAPTPRAKLIRCMIASKKIERSFGHTSILLVGSSGAGKSSAVNHLLDTDEGNVVAKTSSLTSETRMTSEFVLTADNPDFEVSGLTLAIVDSPGFGDSAGPKQDACNFYSIKCFFETHPQLSECYPNLIFVVVSAMDQRIAGPNTNLAKALRALKKLDLVDQENPNVVGILTFCCSVGHRNVQKWEQKMQEKKDVISLIISQALEVQAPVVLLENDPDDNIELEKVGEFTLLPNGERQPKNLYNACLKLLEENGDHFGLLTLNACFTKTKNQCIVGDHKVLARDASEGSLTEEEEDLFKFLDATVKGGIEDPLKDGASQYIQEKDLNQEQQEEMYKLVKTMKKMGLQDENDCNFLSVESVKYFHGSDISDAGVDMLSRKFGINKKEVSLDSDDLVGQGYNIIMDKPVKVQVMKFQTVVDSQFGFQRPVCAKVVKVNETRQFQEEFKDEKSYVESRLFQLDVNIDVAHSICKMAPRVGFNACWNSNGSGDNSKLERSSLIEHRMVELKIANFEEEGISFTKDFKSAVEKLPDQYNVHEDTKKEFKRFFDRFGHFVVTSAYGGGAVEIKAPGLSQQGSEKAELSTAGSANAKSLIIDGDVSGKGSSLSEKDGKTFVNRGNVQWRGGRSDLHEIDTINSKVKMRKWRASLLTKPTLLTTEMSLEPISTVISVHDEGKGRSSYEALEDLLQGKFPRVALGREAVLKGEKKLEFKEEKNKREEEEERERERLQSNTRTGSTKSPDTSDWGGFKTAGGLAGAVAVVIGGVLVLLFKK